MYRVASFVTAALLAAAPAGAQQGEVVMGACAVPPGTCPDETLCCPSGGGGPFTECCCLQAANFVEVPVDLSARDGTQGICCDTSTQQSSQPSGPSSFRYECVPATPSFASQWSNERVYVLVVTCLMLLFMFGVLAYLLFSSLSAEQIQALTQFTWTVGRLIRNPDAEETPRPAAPRQANAPTLDRGGAAVDRPPPIRLVRKDDRRNDDRPPPLRLVRKADRRSADASPPLRLVRNADRAPPPRLVRA